MRALFLTNTNLLLLYQAPPFIEAGEKIVISTADDSYMTRYVIESLIISLLYHKSNLKNTVHHLESALVVMSILIFKFS